MHWRKSNMANSQQPSTQDFVPVRDIRDNVVILKNGQLCSILLASSINFALKSSDEQQAILSQFQAFLNTIDFSLQFYIQSRRLNIQPYLNQLQEREVLQDNDLMRIQLREYMEFIRTFISEVDVMSKNFFIVIPYTPSQIDFSSNISAVFGKKKDLTIEDSKFEENRLQLEQRASLIEQGLARIGVRTIPLQNEELVELYYHIFNPGDPSGSAPPTN
jgi:type IV secretory pathway VirB4 component